NIGSQKIAQAETPATVDDLMPDIRKFFRIEFVNRIDEIIVFQPLETDALVRIAELRFRDLAKRLLERGVESEITPAAATAIAEKSFDPQYGARPINRYIQTHLENPLSRMIISGTLPPKSKLVVDHEQDAFAFRVEHASGAESRPGADKGEASDGRDVEDVLYTEVT
ncbi:MAG: ATPase domain protein, partial [Fibrobacteres bacterium]|nr:ATPase domain protein [Fibrobacterota bacterium]